MATIETVRAEALARAENDRSWANYPAIFEGFTARGIPESEILPRENVLTYRAWQAKGRQVQKGERGVKVTTWIPIRSKGGDAKLRKNGKPAMRPRTATVFHISQTKAIDGVK